MRLLHRRALFFVVLFWVAMGRSVIAQEMRRVTVHLHIDVPTGLALPENYRPELVNATPSHPVVLFSATREAGENNFVMTGEVPESATEVYVVLREWFSADRQFAVPPEVGEKPRLDAFWEFTKQLWTPERLTVHLEAGVHEYSRVVAAEKAVAIRGVFKNEQGKGVAPSMFRQHHSNGMVTTRATSRGFAAFGVRADHATWMAYMLEGEGNEFAIRYLSAAELAADLQLGTVVVPENVVDVRADILVTNLDAIPNGPFDGGEEFRSKGVAVLSAVAEDASRVSVLRLVDGRTRYTLSETPGELAYLKSGVRFLVPGDPAFSPYVEKAMRLLRAGRAGDLVAAGVPRVSPVAGETVTMTVDAGDVVKRVEGIKE